MAEINVTLDKSENVVEVHAKRESPVIQVEVIGSGPQGKPGTDGYSPTITTEEITGGHRLTIIDRDHPEGQTVDVMDGQDGADGVDGQDGRDGVDGQDGADGVSPEVSISSITGGHSVTITDADHPGGQTFNVMDGEDGADGNDGVSPTVSVTTITGGHQVDVTDAGGTTSFNVMDGADGAPGVGVPTGGTTGQVLKKASGTDYDTEWADENDIPLPYTANPAALGTASPGSSDKFARGDHVHEMPYWMGRATCSTAEATTAKTASINNYALKTGSVVSIRFENAVPASATLNISSTGAHAIYYKNSAITADIIKAGDTATFIYSTYYHLISIDRQPSKSDVGLGNVDNIQQYSANNPPPYPVTSVNNQTGAVSLSIPSTAADVGAIPAPASANDDDVLTYDNGSWVAKPPSGGGPGQWTKLIDWTAAEDVASVTFTEGDNDEVLADCTEMWLLMLVCPQTATEYTSGIKLALSGTNVWSTGHIWIGNGIKSSVTGSFMYMLHLVKTPMGILCDARNESYNNGSQISTGAFVSRTNVPHATEYSGLTINSKNIGVNLDNLISDQSFTKILVGGYQTVIGTGSQIRVWGR